MLEVLVALSVLSIGLLGLAAMQTLSLKASQGGMFRTNAAVQAYDIVDRMRANTIGVGLGYYDAIAATIPSAPAACSPCSAVNIRDKDYYDWALANSRLLPQGAGTVTSADGKTFTVTLTWKERADDGAVANTTVDQTLQIVVQL